jgi:hypothetical protein
VGESGRGPLLTFGTRESAACRSKESQDLGPHLALFSTIASRNSFRFRSKNATRRWSCRQPDGFLKLCPTQTLLNRRNIPLCNGLLQTHASGPEAKAREGCVNSPLRSKVTIFRIRPEQNDLRRISHIGPEIGAFARSTADDASSEPDTAGPNNAAPAIACGRVADRIRRRCRIAYPRKAGGTYAPLG